MKHNWTKVLLSAAAITSLFSACKPKPDTDTPFPPAVSTSVFMGSQNQFVYALNPTTGAKKWECYIGANIAASPYLYGGTLFVGNSSALLFKVDPNTGVRDQSKIGFPAGITTTPIGKDNFLFVNSGNTVTSIDIKPDTVEWKYTAGGNINSSATVRDTQMVFGCDDGFVYMIDNRNGNLIWKSKSYSTLFRSSPTMDENLIYIGAENGTLYALKRNDGSEAWIYPTAAPIKSSPVVLGGNIFFGGDDSKLYCLENITGLPRWVFTASDRIRSSPFLYGDKVFVGSYDKNFYAINVLDGSLRWTYKTTGLIAASPVCYNNNVFIGSYDKNLYAIDTASGLLNWKYEINGLMDCSPSIDPNNANGNGINSSISGSTN